MKSQGLDHALNALEPYLCDLIICGAWAWYLYRRCLGPPGWVPVEFTRDLDCLGRERLPARGQSAFDLLQEAGFVWVPRGDDEPPVAHFAWPDKQRPEVEVEFLVPARGDGRRRIVEIQSRLAAQALRNVDILLDEPHSIVVDDDSPLAAELTFRGTIQTPRPGPFVVQKALIHGRRTPQNQVKDLFYVFDLIDSENGLADAVRADVDVTRERWDAEVARFEVLLERRAGEPHFIRAVAEQLPPERRPSESYIANEIRGWLSGLSR